MYKSHNTKLKGCENGPSVEYSDGFCVWSLNDVNVKKEYVMNPYNGD